MNSDILKIISSVTKYNTSEDERSNAIGKKYVIAGKEDGRLGVVDEYGKVSEIGNNSNINIERGIKSGSLVLSSGNMDVHIKWGQVTISDTGDMTTEHIISYEKPFPTVVQTLLVTQNQNDQTIGFMANPTDTETFKLTVTGGNAGEVISYLAIGY